jgi:hypothetical protein
MSPFLGELISSSSIIPLYAYYVSNASVAGELAGTPM